LGDGVCGVCSRRVENNTESVAECDSRTVSCSGDHTKSLSTGERIERMGKRHQQEWRCRKCFFDDVTSEMVFVTCQLEEEWEPKKENEEI